MVPLSNFTVLERVLQIHAVRGSMDDDVSMAECASEKFTVKIIKRGDMAG